MKIITHLRSLISLGFKRFYVALGSSILLFLCTFAAIFELLDTDIMERLAASVVVAMLLSVTLKLICERFSLPKRGEIITAAISAGVIIPCFFILAEIFDDEYITLGWLGVVAALAVAIIWLLFKDADFNTVIPHIIKSTAFSMLISLIVFGGISLCIAAVSFLLVDIEYKWYFVALAFAFETLFVWLLLAALPDKDELVIPKAFKIVFLYAAFPLYLALLAVLYLYLIKIAFTLSLPGGQLNWFASFASLFFILFYYTVSQYDNAFTRFWKRFGGYFLLPIIGIQALAVYIRVNAYGLTSARWVSIIFSATALLFVVLSLIKGGRHVNITIPTFIVILLVSTCTPINFIDIPVYEQTARLEAVLTRSGMLADGNLTANPAVSNEDMEAIRSAWHIVNRSKKAPSYLNGEFEELFGFELYNDYSDDGSYYNFSAEYREIDVKGYSKFGFFDCVEDKYGTAELIIDGKTYIFDDYMFALAENESEKNDAEGSYIFDADDGTRFCFSWINFHIKDDGTLDERYYSGYYLIK